MLIEGLELSVRLDFAVLVMHLPLCVTGLLKTHNLSFQDCESLQAVFDKENCVNVLQAQPRFHSSLIHLYILSLHPFFKFRGMIQFSI